MKAREQELNENKSDNPDDAMQMNKHYRVICGIGCAAIRCVFSCDWNMVTEHLQFAIANDQSNVGVLRYCLSYSLHKSGQYDESNEHYKYFVYYIDDKKAEAEKSKQKASKKEIKIEEDAKQNDAASELSMDYFKWHPDAKKEKISEIVDLCVDFVAAAVLILFTHYLSGYTPHFGNNLKDWSIIGFMMFVSCLVCTPSLGMLLMAVSLPPFDDTIADPPFDYFKFGAKWMCVSAGLLFVYKVVIGGAAPNGRIF